MSFCFKSRYLTSSISLTLVAFGLAFAEPAAQKSLAQSVTQPNGTGTASYPLHRSQEQWFNTKAIVGQIPANRPPEPNLLELQGKGTQIIYSSSSFSGEPQLNYRTQSFSRNFSGKEIRTLDTEIGRLITVTMRQVIDGDTVTLTLLLPTINMPAGVREQPIQTIAIFTIQRSSIGGPSLVKGQLQTYSTLFLKGTARSVNF